MGGVRASDPGRGGARLAAGPAIAVVVGLGWLLPLEWWAIAVLGGAATAIFALVVAVVHERGRPLLAEPAVLASLVMWLVAVFTVAYAVVALEQPGSLATNGGERPDSLGVPALFATSIGIAGGEVGVDPAGGARIVAHIQLLLVVAGVAGAGAEILRRLTGEPPAADQDPLFDLYGRVFRRLTERGGDAVLDELGWPGVERRDRYRETIRGLRPPERADARYAFGVFRRILAGDLEFAYRLPFEGDILGDTVKRFTGEP